MFRGPASEAAAYSLRVLKCALSSSRAAIVCEEVAANWFLGRFGLSRTFCAEVNAAMATPALFCFLFLLFVFLGSSREFYLKKIHGGPETGIIANDLDVSLPIDLRNLCGKSGVAGYK